MTKRINEKNSFYNNKGYKNALKYIVSLQWSSVLGAAIEFYISPPTEIFRFFRISFITFLYFYPLITNNFCIYTYCHNILFKTGKLVFYLETNSSNSFSLVSKAGSYFTAIRRPQVARWPHAVALILSCSTQVKLLGTIAPLVEILVTYAYVLSAACVLVQYV